MKKRLVVPRPPPPHWTYLLIVLCFWQSHLNCALLLPLNSQQQQQQQHGSAIALAAGPTANQQQQQQQQQQQSSTQIITAPNSPNDNSLIGQGANGAILQALSQFAAQQAAANQSLAATGATPTVQQANGQPANANQFVIKWIHNDPKNHMAYVSITPVNYTNLHEPRIELRYQSKYPFVSLDERTPNNTVVAAVVVNDEDEGPNGETSLSIEHGNELGHFKIVSTTFTNTIQVAGAPLSKHQKSEYNLTIVARDHGSPPKSSSSNLVIKLYHSSAPNPPQPNAPPEAQPSLKPPVTDLMYVGAMLVVLFSALIFLIIVGCALVQRPKNKPVHKSGGVGSAQPPSRATSATNSRLHPTDQCSAYCFSLTNLN